jgi:hypothetical protein
MKSIWNKGLFTAALFTVLLAAFVFAGCERASGHLSQQEKTPRTPR